MNQTPDENSILPFERILTTQSDGELILLVLQGKMEHAKLSKKLQEKMERLKQCRNFIHEHLSQKKVIPMMMNTFSISESTANKDYHDTLKVYNATHNSQGRDFWIDAVLGDIQKVFNMAIKAKDLKAAAKCNDQKMAAIEKFFNNAPAELYAALQPPILITRYIPNTKLPEDVMERALAIVNKKKKKREESEYTIFEEITEQDGE